MHRVIAARFLGFLEHVPASQVSERWLVGLRRSLASLIVVLSCSLAAAEQVVEQVSWRELDEAGKLLNGQFVPAKEPDDRDVLRVENPGAQARTVTVLLFERPKISTLCHAIVGEVAHEDMGPASHLEMWTTFEGSEMAFTRTLSPDGPMKNLAWTSDWRPFILPLYSVKGMGPPRRIELNVAFTGGGSVSLGPVRLVEYGADESPLPDVTPPPEQPIVRPNEVGQVSWAQLDDAGTLLAGKVARGEPPDPTEQLVVEHAEEERKSVTVAVIEKPSIDGFIYQVGGWVKHDDVAPGSYLEMWSTMADGRRFFTRTLAQSGPMRNLDGSYDWRPFVLPFHSSEEAGLPTRLEINVVFAGPGTVRLSPLRIVQHAAAPQSAAGAQAVAARGARPGGWWGNRTGIMVATIGGVSLGFLGALEGILGGLGVARRFVLALAILEPVCGLAALVAGFVALGLGQPYLVWFPLLLLGGIATMVGACVLPAFRQRYAEIELRRMTAMDLGAGRKRA